MVGISNFPLISSIRMLSLLPCRRIRDSLKATPLFQGAQDSCALDSSDRTFDASVSTLASSLIVDVGRIRELIFRRETVGAVNLRSSLSRRSRLPPLAAVYPRWECIFGEKGRDMRHVVEYWNEIFLRDDGETPTHVFS